MSDVKEIGIQLDGISNILKTRRFRVPPYQRSYAWESEHVEALLSDIGDAINGDEKEYFLGSIVVTGPSNDRRFEVVDGQQRLATISLLIAAIKEKFRDEGDQDAEMAIRNDFLANVDRKTKERESKLALNEIDNELYQELINDQTAINFANYPRSSHKRLLLAAKVMRAHIDKLCAATSDSEELLHDWLDYLENNLKVILVTAPDDSNAFVIFETLNDRGLELAISDLLKNYLFHRSGDKLDEMRSRWMTMVNTLESASEEPLVVPYLRHFAMSKYGLVREKDLFGLIKRKVAIKRHALQFSTELSNTAKIYAALINTDHELWGKYDAKAREAVFTLNLLGMVQVRPLLLAILDKFEPKRVSIAFQRLVSVSVRFQIVGGTGGGTLERIYSEAARGVAEGKLTTIDQVLKVFTTLPNDAAFIYSFSVATISKPNLARYYLRMLESGVPGASGEMVPNQDTLKVNLEHVLPLSPSGQWLKEWNTDDAKAYCRRLGNLAILSSKVNSGLGNEAFSKKSPEFKKSSFKLTKIISKYKAWNKKAIDERQMDMAKIAAKLWSLKG